ncbi:MAG: hypothetical protein Q4G46_05215 [Propionibacteriaceae bacterium]|nr:hypothetical protein [Propionibacteriaceae bacterium]
MKQRIGLMLAVFSVVTAVVSAVGFWLHARFAIAYWVVDLGSLGPFAGGLAVLMLNRRLNLGARWVPGLGFNVQVVRRVVLAVAIALAIVLSCVQFYTFFRWRMKPIELPLVPHPLALPGDSLTILVLVGVGMTIGLILQEFGFRTVLQPSLRERYSVLTTSVIIGLIWGTWSWPAWQAALDRFGRTGSVLVLLLFLVFHYAMTITVSLLFVTMHSNMRTGHWASAVAFRLVYGLGFFLILDEEQAMWQPMFAISLACALAAGVSFYYYRRAALAERGRPARDKNADPAEPGGVPPRVRSNS